MNFIILLIITIATILSLITIIRSIQTTYTEPYRDIIITPRTYEFKLWSSNDNRLLDDLMNVTFINHITLYDEWNYKNFVPRDIVSNMLYLQDNKITLQCLKDARIYMLGTSFLRAIFFEYVKILENVQYLSVEQKFIPSYECKLGYGKECKNKTILENDTCVITSNSAKDCNLPGLAGHNITICGRPHNKTTKSNKHNISTHFQFKTYINTLESDSIVSAELIESPPNLLILGSGEWGRNLFIVPEQNYDTQVDIFYSKLFNDYKGKKIFIYNKNYNKSTERMWLWLKKAIDKGDKSIMILNMDAFEMRHVVSENKPPDGHGHEGPITEAIARIILIVLCGR